MTTKAAESKVAALERLSLGEPWAELAGEAERAIAALREAAAGELFPSALSPTPAAAWAALAHLSRRYPAGAYGRHLADLHRRSLGSWPELAELCRQPEQLRDVGEAATTRAPATREAAAKAARGAQRSYQTEIARQLIDNKHALAGAARQLLAADELADRLAAAVQRHKEHAAEELRRQEDERAAAERVLAEEQARGSEEAKAEAARLDAKARAAAIRARQLRGEHLAARLRASGLDSLRIEDRSYNVESLAWQARQMSEEQLRQFEAGLDRALGGRR